MFIQMQYSLDKVEQSKAFDYYIYSGFKPCIL